MERTDRAVPSSGLSSDLTVLHVADDPRFAELTRLHLERARETLTVVTETDPEAALEWLESEAVAGGTPVDCIVSDYRMPRLNGLELLRAVRERFPSLPFVLYTGQGSEEVAADAEGFYVEDDGPGIPPERGELVFEHGFINSAEGTGVGLAIVRSIVEAHG